MIKGLSILPLLIQKDGEQYHGLVDINDNPINGNASSIEQLKEKFKSLVYLFEGIQVDDFDIQTEKTEACKG